MPKERVENVSSRDWAREFDDLKYRLSSLEKKKVEKEVVETKFEGVEKMHETSMERITEDIKGVKSDVKELHTKMSKRSSVQLGGIVALVVTLIGGASFILKLTTKVDKNTESIETLTDSVGEVQTSTQEIKGTVEEIKVANKKGEAELLDKIRSTVENAVEATIDIKPRRKR